MAKGLVCQTGDGVFFLPDDKATVLKPVGYEIGAEPAEQVLCLGKNGEGQENGRSGSARGATVLGGSYEIDVGVGAAERETTFHSRWKAFARAANSALRPLESFPDSTDSTFRRPVPPPARPTGSPSIRRSANYPRSTEYPGESAHPTGLRHHGRQHHPNPPGLGPVLNRNVPPMLADPHQPPPHGHQPNFINGGGREVPRFPATRPRAGRGIRHSPGRGAIRRGLW